MRRQLAFLKFETVRGGGRLAQSGRWITRTTVSRLLSTISKIGTVFGFGIKLMILVLTNDQSSSCSLDCR